jgi:hypothetical protein
MEGTALIDTTLFCENDGSCGATHNLLDGIIILLFPRRIRHDVGIHL